ncbi:hypothetical protein Tcan_12309 [Toxocara canis]|uniref:Uncharacterized protein n=1 Tax=Toxocara canis TaxID=6265 RepID=A0A0B2VFC9_TOXCA|nr:hypothetical protein Tcan_12309 [Toxocara canis]
MAQLCNTPQEINPLSIIHLPQKYCLGTQYSPTMMKSEDVHESEENAQNRMFVAGTSLRWTWLQEKIRASLKTTAKFGQNFVYERIGIGQGYMSLIERVHPNWTEAGELLPQTFIVKIPSTEPSRRAVASAKERTNYFSGTDYDTFFVELERTVQHYHHTEISFYEMVKTNHLRLKIPKAYLLQRPDSENSQGVIIMEDIGEDSTVFATYDNLTPEDMYQIMDELAELHRFCMECTEWTTLRGLSLASSIRHHDQRQVEHVH